MLTLDELYAILNRMGAEALRDLNYNAAERAIRAKTLFEAAETIADME
jgi:hypothetical protein